MMACWNVAAVYKDTGTECAELHRVVFQMIEVLREFDDSFKSSPRKNEIVKAFREKGEAEVKRELGRGGELEKTGAKNLVFCP
jgi:sulfur relay (sulfurtransferase) DsrC/TusE family protein